MAHCEAASLADDKFRASRSASHSAAGQPVVRVRPVVATQQRMMSYILCESATCALDAWTRQVGRRQVSSISSAGGHLALTGLARCVPQLAAFYKIHYGPPLHCRSQPLPDNGKKARHAMWKRIEDAGCCLSSHSARDACSRYEARPPASVRPSRGKKMRPPHAPTSQHRRPIGRFLGGIFDRRLLALRHVIRDALTGREAHLSLRAVQVYRL